GAVGVHDPADGVCRVVGGHLLHRGGPEAGLELLQPLHRGLLGLGDVGPSQAIRVGRVYADEHDHEGISLPSEVSRWVNSWCDWAQRSLWRSSAFSWDRSPRSTPSDRARSWS